MAIRINKNRGLNALEVVSKNDDALDLEQSKWEEYEETGDISKLCFLPDRQPTVFLCNFEIKGKQAESIKNNMLGGRDDDGNPKVSLGSWSFRVVKNVLKDIKNPSDMSHMEALIMKKDKDGLVHDDLLADLDNMGVIDAIFGMYTRLVLGGAKANAKN